MRQLMNTFFVFLMMCGTASAAPDETALTQFVAGDFEEAAITASEAGGAENLAFAARSLNAKAYLQVENKPGRKFAKRALEHAEDAIELDGGLVEAHVQAAISLAQRGSRMAPLRAFFLGVADRARDELDIALAKEPGNALALSSSGAWHLEVARRVGEGRFGSDPILGYQQVLAAREARPQDVVVAYETALRLLAYEKLEWRPDALMALEDAVSGSPIDAFETAIQNRAKELSAAIDQGPEAERTFIEVQP